VLAAVAGLAGLVLGLLWGWVIQPVKWTNATPEVLRADLQEDYLRMAIDSYQANGDANLAVQHWDALGKDAPAIFAEIQQEPGKQNPAVIKAFGQQVEAVEGAVVPTMVPSATPSQVASPKRNSFVTYGIVIAALLVLLAVAVALFFFLRRSDLLSRFFPKGVSANSPDTGYAYPEERMDFQAPPPVRTTDASQPMTQTMTTYVVGDDLYDESFSIDSPAGEFLGEYGVGVSETIGVGDPKKVTALEVWLFDKNDIKTATKVLMSAHAYRDQAVRQRLEAKGELVLIQPKQQVLLETATLQLRATVAEVEYGQGALPEESYFERVTLELSVWPKAD
jgi:hypothetical protein